MNTNTQEENVYTLETLPKTIYNNEFYCYSSFSGKIYIGTILGKSAIMPYYKYDITGRTFDVYEKDAFSETKTEIKLRDTNFICFKNYNDLVASYNDYLKGIEEKKKTSRKKRTYYLVDTKTFLCRTTTVETGRYNNKLFDNKADAVAYATKGLKRLSKKLEKLIKTMNAQREILSKAARTNYSYIGYYGNSLGTYLQEIMATPKNIKKGDILVKIDYIRYKRFNTRELIKDFSVEVKDFITPEVAMLSDNTLLINRECRSYSAPMFIKEESAKTAESLLKKTALKTVIELVERELKSLGALTKYVNEYTPFKKGYSYIYFGEKYENEMVKDLDDFIRVNNLNNG